MALIHIIKRAFDPAGQKKGAIVGFALRSAAGLAI